MEHFDTVDAYLDASTQWPDEIRALRPVLLGAGLDEEVKWGKPCYSHDGGNIAIVQEFADNLALMFFKGILLDDPEDVLEEVGPNSHAARRIMFSSVEDVEAKADVVTAHVRQAVALEDRLARTGAAQGEAMVDHDVLLVGARADIDDGGVGIDGCLDGGKALAVGADRAILRGGGVAVVVEAVAELGGAWVDRGVDVVAVLGRHEAIVVCVETVRNSV